VYSDLKNWNRAIEIANDLQKKYPTKEDVYSILASLYKETKNYDKVIEAYNQLEKLMGIEESVSMEKFQLYILCNKYKKAIAEIDKLVEKYPTQTQYKVLRGDIYMQQKMPEQAFAIYQKVVADDPQNANVYLSLSEYYNGENQPEKAMQSIVKALENEQLDVNTKVAVLGQYVEKLLQDSTKLDQTESLFKLLIDRYPMEEQVHSYYAQFLLFRNRNSEAVSELETMLNINSKNQQTWLKLIQIYTADKNYQAILETTAKAILELPSTPAWYFYRGIAHYQLNDFTNALATYKAALPYIKKNQPDVAGDFYAQIADVNYKLQNKDSAFLYYEKALLANPKNTMVMNNYAYYLSLEKKELNKAEKMSAKTVELEPKNSTFLDTYAWILYQQASYSLARFYIERALDNLPKEEDRSVVLEHCGDIYWMYGKENKAYEAKALEMWQKACDAGIKTDELKKKIENKGWKRTQ
jgi:tetratricopeptide (TPR) repeat protein